MSRTTRLLAPVTVAVAAAFTLAACGSDANDAGSPATPMMSGSMPGMDHTSASPASPETAAGEHNDADVAFATGMIPHHAQAVEMADLALRHAGSSAVRQLATAIKEAQNPEIVTMSGWLTGWAQPVPTAGMNHGGQPVEGMMTEREMEALAKARGRDLDVMWLTMMIRHHQGAVTMAVTEQTSGKYPAATALAQRIQAAQNAEITRMRGLLAGMSPR
jgi:uncharacterized protein (DUF305 family)